MQFAKFILIYNQSNTRVSIVLNLLDHSVGTSSSLFNFAKVHCNLTCNDKRVSISSSCKLVKKTSTIATHTKQKFSTYID